MRCGPSLAHGLRAVNRAARRDILRTVAIRKRADALPHRPREAKRELQRCEPTISFGKRTRAGKHLAATCCTNATETRCATLAATEGSGASRSRRARKSYD